jgi:hypothetical protein
MVAADFLWGPGALGMSGQMGPRATRLFNTANIVAGILFSAPASGVIDSIQFNVSAKTGANRDLQARFVTVDVNGMPTTTQYGGSSAETLTITGTGHKTITFATGATVTRGDRLALRLDPTGTAPDGSNNFTVETMRDVYSAVNFQAYPAWVRATDGGTSWTSDGGLVSIGVRYASGGDWIFADLGDSPTSITTGTAAILSGGSPNEYGAKFTVPYALDVVGVRFANRMNVNTPIEIKLYDSGSTLLRTERVYPLAGTVNRVALAIWGSAYTLAANTVYRVAMTNLSAVDTVREPYYVTVQSAAQKDAWPFCDGQAWQRTHRTGAGAWTDVATDLPMWALICRGAA